MFADDETQKEELLKTQTRSTTLATPAGDVFAYVSEPENLPAWAPAFARSVENRGDCWTATTADRVLDFRLRTHAELGIVDFLIRAGSRYVLTAPTRIVATGTDECEYLFTLLALPGEDDTRFERRLATVDDELASLRDRFQGAVIR